jgi:hypothetical protein
MLSENEWKCWETFSQVVRGIFFFVIQGLVLFQILGRDNWWTTLAVMIGGFSRRVAAVIVKRG